MPEDGSDAEGRTPRTHLTGVTTRCLRTSDEQRPSPIDGNRTGTNARSTAGGSQSICRRRVRPRRCRTLPASRRPGCPAGSATLWRSPHDTAVALRARTSVPTAGTGGDRYEPEGEPLRTVVRHRAHRLRPARRRGSGPHPGAGRRLPCRRGRRRVRAPDRRSGDGEGVGRGRRRPAGRGGLPRSAERGASRRRGAGRARRRPDRRGRRARRGRPLPVRRAARELLEGRHASRAAGRQAPRISSARPWSRLSWRCSSPTGTSSAAASRKRRTSPARTWTTAVPSGAWNSSTMRS